MSYPTPAELPSFFLAETPGDGIDPDDAQIPDDQGARPNDDPEDETDGDEGDPDNK